MKKILVSLGVIAIVAVAAVSATGAFFSDTETSTGNTFTAGEIDLKVDSTQHYNNAVCVDGYWALEKDATLQTPQYPKIGDSCGGTWGQLNGKDIVSENFFNFGDVKPGDSGENTVSLHVDNNDAWACVSIIPTKNDDVSSTGPELKAGDVANTDSIYDGELAQNMDFLIWADICTPNATGGTEYPNAVAGDNIYQERCDVPLTSGHGPITPTTWALADSSHPNVFTGSGPLASGNNYYIGVGWKIPGTVGNIIQTDTYQANISFYVEQSRNNGTFVCPSVAPQANTLKLENETIVQDGPWIVINDDIGATLTWTGNGQTFDFTLNGKVPVADADYSLIYYADGWPGNNPGAFIGYGHSNPSGNISFSGNPDLGISMPTSPDGNLAVGAKIWLVLSSDYNSGAHSTGPMTAWQPDKYLFEGNVYIHYTHTP